MIDSMDDKTAWERGLTFLQAAYSALENAVQADIRQLVDAYARTKQAAERLTAGAGGEALCRECAGQCCMNGKYRISGTDALAIVVAGNRAGVIPDFGQKPYCPYSTPAGCCFEPSFRPASCIQFICPALDELLSTPARDELAGYESKLALLVQQLEQASGLKLALPLLLLAEQLAQPGIATSITPMR